MKRHCTTLLAALTIAATACLDSSAAAVTYYFSGHLTEVHGSALTSSFSVNQAFVGSFTYDTNDPDADPSPAIGLYETSPGITVKLVGFQLDIPYGAASRGATYTANDTSFDTFGVAAATDLFGTAVNGVDPWDVIVQLSDNTATALGTDALPATVDLAAWSHAVMTVKFNAYRHEIAGFIDQLGLTPFPDPAEVPEPGSLGMLALGLGLVAVGSGLSRRRSAAMSAAAVEPRG